MDLTPSKVSIGNPKIVMRNYLSTHHLYAARYAAEDAQQSEREQNLRGSFIRGRGHVLSAISESVSFLEATINELFQDAADDHPSYVAQLDSFGTAKMAAVWEATRDGQRLDTIAKYNLALSFLDHDRFEPGTAPLQPTQLLIRLRNYVVHYRPHDVSPNESAKLGEALRQQGILGNPNFPGNPWFPDQALSSSCAQWAWRTARDFTDSFARRIQIDLNYQLADFGDPLPQP